MEGGIGPQASGDVMFLEATAQPPALTKGVHIGPLHMWVNK